MKAYLFILSLGLFSLIACDKQNNNSSLLVTVLYQDKALQQATVQIVNDTTGTGGTISFSQQGGTDASGQVFFGNLNPGKYYISASGYVTSVGTVRGSAHTSLAFSSSQSVTINAQ